MTRKDDKSDAYDLRVGVAIARNDFDLVEKLDEPILAAALRSCADESQYPHLLYAMADALDHPDAEFRLRLVRNRKGRPNKRLREYDEAQSAYVAQRMAVAGVPLKAAVMDAMEHFNCSRATVLRSMKRQREWQQETQRIIELLDSKTAAKETDRGRNKS